MTIHSSQWEQDASETGRRTEPDLKPILYLGKHSQESDEIRAWIEQFSKRPTFLLNPENGQDHWIAQNARRHSAVLIDVDDVGGNEEGVSLMLLFQHFAPEVPVVMLSEGYSEDTYGDAGVSLCAANLKKPTNMLRVIEALSHAMVVHPYHYEQAYEMSYDRD